jgi:hypothetical protein
LLLCSNERHPAPTRYNKALLVQVMDLLPLNAHVCVALYTDLRRDQIAELYRTFGWRVRKCSWVDYEVTSDWIELVIQSERPILVSGVVVESLADADGILAPLRDAEIGYDAEFYTEQQELLQELKWRPRQVRNV